MYNIGVKWIRDRPIMASKIELILYTHVMVNKNWSIDKLWHKICRPNMEQYNWT